jgi:hypothetical protein
MACRLALFAMLVPACASDRPAIPTAAAPERMIVDILTIKTADSLTVVIEGDQPLAYSVMEQDAPRALVITFADTGFDRLGPVYFPPENFAVHSIQTVQIPDKSMKARAILGLNGSAAYKLVPEKNNLKVVFTKTTAPAPGAASRPSPVVPTQEPQSPTAQPATAPGVLKGVNVASHGGGVAIYMRVDGKVENYKTFTIDDSLPARIVVDLIGIRSAFEGEQKIPGKGNIVKRVRHLGYPDKVRVVVETEKGYLTDFSLKPVDSGVVLQVGGSTRKEN